MQMAALLSPDEVTVLVGVTEEQKKKSSLFRIM